MPWKKIKSPGLAELLGIISHTPIKPFAVKRPTLQPLPQLLITQETKPEQSKEDEGLLPPHNSDR